MSGYGLEVYDSAGVRMVHEVDRLPSVFGVYPFSILAGSTSPLTISAPGVNGTGTFYCLAQETQLYNPICGANVITMYFYTGSPTQAGSGNVTVFAL